VTFWEGIGTNGSMYEGAYTSAAHGWSTGVLLLLTNFVLGVTPTGPGFQTWTIKPIPGDVTWARGLVPTPKGPLSVYWTMKKAHHCLIYRFRSLRVHGRCDVPVSNKNSEVTVDGNRCGRGKQNRDRSHPIADGYVTVPVQSGNHKVTVKNEL